VRAAELRGEFRSGFEQTSGVGVLWPFGDLGGWADFDDLSAIHYGDTGCEVTHYGHGMRDEEVGQSEFALQLRQEIHDLRTYADVERRDGLVRDDELWTQRQRPGDSDSLPLPSAEFVREALHGRLVEADRLEQLGNSRSPGGRMHAFVNNQWFADDVIYAHAGIERTKWILKDDLHVTAKSSHFATTGREQVAAFEQNFAGGRLNQP